MRSIGKKSKIPNWPEMTVDNKMTVIEATARTLSHTLHDLYANDGLEARTVLGDEAVDRLLKILEGEDDGTRDAVEKIKGTKFRKKVEFPPDAPF